MPGLWSMPAWRTSGEAPLQPGDRRDLLRPRCSRGAGDLIAITAVAWTPSWMQPPTEAESRRGFLLAVPWSVYWSSSSTPSRSPSSWSSHFPPAGPPRLNLSWTGTSTRTRGWLRRWWSRWCSAPLWLAASTVICLLLGYPFAYYIATRGLTMRNVLLVLVLIPFWSNFLVRTYAWRVLLGSEGPISQLSQLLGRGETRCCSPLPPSSSASSTDTCPSWCSLYAAIERIDWSLVEAGRDLYASGWRRRRHLWPLSRARGDRRERARLHPGAGRLRHPRSWAAAPRCSATLSCPSSAGAQLAVQVGASVAILAVMLGATWSMSATGAERQG